MRAPAGALLAPAGPGSRSDADEGSHAGGGGALGGGAKAEVVEEPLAELRAEEARLGVRTYGLRKVFPRGVAVQVRVRVRVEPEAEPEAEPEPEPEP